MMSLIFYILYIYSSYIFCFPVLFNRKGKQILIFKMSICQIFDVTEVPKKLQFFKKNYCLSKMLIIIKIAIHKKCLPIYELGTWTIPSGLINRIWLLDQQRSYPGERLTCSCDQSICFSIKRPFSLTKIYLRKIFKIQILNFFK